MFFNHSSRSVCTYLLLGLQAISAAGQSTAAGSSSGSGGGSSGTISTSSTSKTATSKTGTAAPTTSTSAFDPDAPADVVLHVPKLSVGRIELDVDNLQADINLAADVASLVTINAGVQVGITEVNITITDIEAKLDLEVRLGHLVDIVARVFGSLDLNPLIISTLGNATQVVNQVIGAVDGLLGSITQGGSVLNFVVDNLGNIVQEVTAAGGAATNSIVGNYLTNMTSTGAVKDLGNGLTQKTFNYSPLNSLVDIVFNTAGQVVQATVQKSKGSTGTGSSPSGSGTAAQTSPTPTAAKRA